MTNILNKNVLFYFSQVNNQFYGNKPIEKVGHPIADEVPYNEGWPSNSIRI